MKKILFTTLCLTTLLHYTHAQGFRNGMIAASPGSTNENGVYYYAGLDEKPNFPDRKNSFEKQIADKVSTEQYKDSWGSDLNIVLSFIIEKDGSVTNAEVVNNHAPATGKETIDATVKEVINTVKAIKTKWNPGKYNGKKVRTGMEISIRIPIHKSDKQYKDMGYDNVKEVEASPGDTFDAGVEPPQDKSENAVYPAAGLQVSPEFPGGIKAFYNFVTSNIKKENLVKGAEGTELKVYVTFIVEKDGYMTGIKLLRDPGFGLGKETVRVLKQVKTMWSPGIQNGKPVRAQYNLPIVIKLPK